MKKQMKMKMKSDQVLIKDLLIRDPPRTNGWKLAHCPPSGKWGPDGNTGEIKAARIRTGHPTSQCQWPRTNVLCNRHSPAN